MRSLNRYPHKITIQTGEETWIHLSSENQRQWYYKDMTIELVDASNGFQVIAQSPNLSLLRIQFTWEETFLPETKFLGDAFERGYGDLGFELLKPDRIMPWYFMAVYQGETTCYGVKTAPNALCSWQVNDQSIDLWMDIRNGTLPLQLGNRALEAATVVFSHNENHDPFEALTSFCSIMCPSPNIPKDPVYGGNDWYYAYGNNSEELILEHTRLIAELSSSNEVRPFMVIDDGWQIDHSSHYNGGPWHQNNQKFSSMHELANQIKAMGVRPGIWFRPLLTNTMNNEEHFLHSDKERDEYVLDISHPDVLKRVGEDIERFVAWGYEMIKHDFTTFDLFGYWGKDMNLRYTDKVISFYNKSLTTAEIINAFYNMIEEKSKGAYIIGCNTVSHLSAGVFAIQRTGDDTSGTDFGRTRKMGVNTLAYRMPQHKTFYLSDADCVGITAAIPWSQNKKWLNVLSSSGTPLFVSCNPKELTEEMIADLQEAFQLAGMNRSSAVPMDWLYNQYPSKWKMDERIAHYEWYNTPRDLK
ncbi:alpha-galactosidase [Paenibacillus albus]|uniref:Alpha-galactosidase n=1 Tax=Paenibacillus albus TaxID=2495582 RepID=A0A3Q8X6I0_9BACL|nr:alpha-galactosidase [Paenibacillus albus]AZN41597.1 hypothetical protein EJC50_19385 [Paenibacillus albus]